MSSTPSEKSAEKPAFVDETKIGDLAAVQPLSGVGTVSQSGAVNGRGGFVYKPQSEQTSKTSAA